MKRVRLRGVALYIHDYEAVSDAIRAAEDFYEAPILDALRAAYPVQRTIVDVGANLGNHSVYWCAFAKPARLVAVEPVPASYALLRRNLRWYPFASALPVALGDQQGEATMTLDPVNMGRCHFDRAGDIRVPLTTLDALDLRDVSLIKVDVEGQQAAVIAGGRATIERDRPLLLVEDGEGTVPDALAGLRYRVAREWPGSNFLWVPA